MQLPLRIAILECDKLLEQSYETYGGFFGVFKALLYAGAKALNDEEDYQLSEDSLDITLWDVAQAQYPNLEDIDAILITGSRANSFDDDPWILKLVEFTQMVLAQDRVRAIGVCFGHQILGRAMGVESGRSETGWEVSVSPMEMSEDGEKLFGKDTISLQQMHQDQLFKYPSGVEQLGHSTHCNVQGMHIKGRLLSIQGHPEFTEPIVREILIRIHDQKIFDDDFFNEAMERVGRDHDGILVAQAFLKFLLEE